MKNVKYLLMLVIVIGISSCGLFKRTKTADKQKIDVIESSKVETTSSQDYLGQVTEQVMDKGTVVIEKETTITTEKPGSSTSITIRKDSLKPGVNILKDSLGREVKAVLDTLQNLLTLDITTPPEKTTTTVKEKTTELKDQTTNRQEENQSRSDQKNVAVEDNRRKESLSNTQKTSTPSVFGTLALWVGIGLAAVIVLWFIFKKFKK